MYVDRRALPPHLARRRRMDARDALDQDGLPRAVVTRQCGDLPRRNVEIDTGEGPHRAEALADALQPEQRLPRLGRRGDRRAVLGARTHLIRDVLLLPGPLVKLAAVAVAGPRSGGPATAGVIG